MDALAETGAVVLEPLAGSDAVRDRALQLLTARGPELGLPGEDPELLSAIELPAAEGQGNESFQALHFDFGMPLVPGAPGDVVALTAIHVPIDRDPPSAVTRVVPLHPLLAQRRWPAPAELLERIASYGRSHGSWLGWEQDTGYREAQLARLVDAATGTRELLAYPEIERDRWLEASRGGHEFADLAEEEAFFARHGIDLAAAEMRIRLAPGESLLLDNVAVAHGRLGERRPREIVQLTFGYRGLDADRQKAIRDRLLSSFGGNRPEAAPNR